MKNPIKNFAVIVQVDKQLPAFHFQHFCDLEESDIFSTEELIQYIICLSEYENNDQKLHFEVMSQLFFDTTEVKSQIPAHHSSDLSAILNINVKKKKKKTTYAYDMQFVDSKIEMQLEACKIDYRHHQVEMSRCFNDDPHFASIAK